MDVLAELGEVDEAKVVNGMVNDALWFGKVVDNDVPIGELTDAVLRFGVLMMAPLIEALLKVLSLLLVVG